ncbi:MAG: 3-phosphoshikimate 1-carboxyvinyltransferase [Woeseiaceae bacterium]|nr:3-phosphoshikimate 1-carboxyvinyltransferase [Woeseiaceae bacterium]
MHFLVNPGAVTSGIVTVPGDKSVSHRALMLGSIADGQTRVSGFLDGEDCLATLAAMRSMGVGIERISDSELSINGVGRTGLSAPDVELDLGNSGTAMRLMAGLLAGQPFSSTLTGDHSLTGRPMRRIIKPLSAMGARINSRDGMPPLVIDGNPSLTGIDYALPIASAQVKSSILIAGLYADGVTTVTEPDVTRDHTERMLRSMGVDVKTDGNRISLEGGQELAAANIDVPADLSSATFVILAALLADNAEVVLEKVGVNPTRTGVLDILSSMGADIALENERSLAEEPVADIRVKSSELQGEKVDPALVSLAIDEFPALFVAAAAARGTTIFTGLEELRVKESDRIASMAAGLKALGADVTETDDGAIVKGGGFKSGTVESFGDHRVAMSLAVAGTVAEGAVTVLDTQPVETSFPGFASILGSLGADIAAGEGAGA